MYKYFLYKVIRFSLIVIVRKINNSLRSLTYWGHRIQFFLQWQTGGFVPSWFDHELDINYLWKKTQSPFLQ